MMLSMQQQGLSYDFSSLDATANIRETEAFDYVNDLMIAAGNPMGEAEPVFTLPDTVSTPEAIAWDESRQQFLIGTAKEGSILAVDNEGQLTELFRANEENGMWGVYGLLIDQKNNRLWVSSASSPTYSAYDPANKGRSALFEFDLKSLELIRHYPVPVDGRSHNLGNMVLSPNGDIYVLDQALPILYRKKANEQKLEIVLVTRDMISMRGIASQPDGRVLYLADREMGILLVDLEGQKAGKLVLPDNLNIGGIDGLYLWENHLIMIQNGIKPQRVMRLELDETGTKVVAVRPLAVAQPVFDSPSFGTLKGNELIYFANSQPASAKQPLKPVAVVRTAVDSNEDLAQPSLEDLQNYLKKAELRNTAPQKKD
jgi:sugar lactone lactonase YvrE